MRCLLLEDYHLLPLNCLSLTFWNMRFSTAILAATSLLTCFSRAYAPTHQFDQTSSTWYPYIQGILHGKCSPEFTSYQHRNATAGSPKDRTLAVLNCVLGELSEYHKANIAASAVMLGAAPMILQTLGSMTAETGLLSLRRPFLSLLLAAGSPAVVAQKGSEFIEMLSRYVGEGETRSMGLPGFRWRSVPFGYRPLIGLAEYLVGGGAVANVIQLAYRLGRHAVVVFATDTTYLPPLWTFLAVVIHLSGALVLHLRVKVARSKVTGKRQLPILEGVDYYGCRMSLCRRRTRRRVSWFGDGIMCCFMEGLGF